jgi:DNA uptake protein ComE-like DNA-binding protein
MLIVLSLTMAACGLSPATSQPAQVESAGTVSPVSSVPSSESAASTKLNLNTATAEELLAAIPGFGNRMVREFQEYRPYVSIQQFRREIGKYVDDAQIAEYEQYVYVPIAVNDSDAATLQQIPGLEPAEAEALIAGRPYASEADFLAALAEYVSGDELATAQTYLSGQ